jgi:hypothetical protein
MIAGECANPPGRAINADAGSHLEWMPLDACLELLIAIMGEPHRAAGKKHRRQRDVERKRRVVAAAEAAADIRELGVDARRLERRAGFAQEVRERLRGLVWRLHAEHELEVIAARVVPSKSAFRLEKHRIDRLGLEFAVQHQKSRILRCKLRADLLAVGRRFGIGAPRRRRRPIPAHSVRHNFRADPAFLQWRVDVGRIRRWAGHARKAPGAVVGQHDGAGLIAEFHEAAVAQRKARLIEGVEPLEDQQSHGLAEIMRCLADRAEQVAGIEFGNAGTDLREIGRGHHRRGFERPAQARKIDAGVDVRGIGGAHKHGVRSIRRPTRQIGGAEIRRA